MTQRNRGGGRPSIGRILLYFFFALLVCAIGTGFVWTQYFGVPARVTVEHCELNKSRLPLVPESWQSKSCYVSGATGQGSMQVYGAGWGDVGHDIDVHIGGGSAVKDGWRWEPVFLFGFGVVFGLIAIRAVVRRLRPAPDVTAESVR